MEFEKVTVILSDEDYISKQKMCELENRQQQIFKRIIKLIFLIIILAWIIAGIFFLSTMAYIGLLCALIGAAVFLGIMMAILNNIGAIEAPDDYILLSHLIKDKGYKIINIRIHEEISEIYLDIENTEKEVEQFILSIACYKVRKKTNMLKPVVNLKDKELVLPYGAY